MGVWAVDVDCARPDVQKRVHSAARKVRTAAASLPGSCDQGGKQEACPVSGGNKIQFRPEDFFYFIFFILWIHRLAPDGLNLERTVNDSVCFVVMQQQRHPKSN